MASSGEAPADGDAAKAALEEEALAQAQQVAKEAAEEKARRVEKAKAEEQAAAAEAARQQAEAAANAAQAKAAADAAAAKAKAQAETEAAKTAKPTGEAAGTISALVEEDEEEVDYEEEQDQVKAAPAVKKRKAGVISCALAHSVLADWNGVVQSLLRQRLSRGLPPKPKRRRRRHLPPIAGRGSIEVSPS